MKGFLSGVEKNSKPGISWLRAAALLLVGTVLCGGIYTGLITGLGQLLFPYQANGSILTVDGKAVGSALLGQPFQKDTHLWGRMTNADCTTFLDETGKPLYYGQPANRAPAGEALEAEVQARVKALRAAHPEQGDRPIPVDLVTYSASGLDPHISVAAAEYQLPRLQRTTGKSLEELEEIVANATSPRLFGLFGEERVNVLQVNLLLDGIVR